ncbi:MAG: hypothetical protein AABW45_01825 [Nanoarchaeota archaeon]
MDNHQQTYIGYLRNFDIIEITDEPMQSVYPLFPVDKMFYYRRAYASKTEGGFLRRGDFQWKKIHGPFKTKKDCAFHFLEELGNKNIRLNKISLERVLKTARLTYQDLNKEVKFGIGTEDLQKYYRIDTEDIVH